MTNLQRSVKGSMSQTNPGRDAALSPDSAAALRVTSPDFANGARIPRRHASRPEGENAPPTITWSGMPQATKELALIVDDPDAPSASPWIHWVIYGIPPTASSVPRMSSTVVEGKNSWKARGWGGPLPPPGHGLHHYRFRVYALDANLSLGGDIGAPELSQAMDGHILAEGELVGTYER